MSAPKKRSTQVLQKSFDWGLPSKPSVVNAKLDLLNNQVQLDATQPPSPQFRQQPYTEQRQQDVQQHQYMEQQQQKPFYEPNGWTMPGQTEPIIAKQWHETSAIPASTIASASGSSAHPFSSISKKQQQQKPEQHEFKPLDRHDAGNEEALLTTSFKLNISDNDNPTFSQVMDYTLFRQKPVVPLGDDVLYPPTGIDNEFSLGNRGSCSLPHIPINVIQGPYKSADHYLATHFELMRQDTLIPLQKAVASYRASIAANAAVNQSSLFDCMDPQETPPPPSSATYSRDFRAYERVQLNAVVYGPRQISYRITFRLPYTVRVSWPTSKRLIEGSLVLLSKDNFEKDIKIATVVNRGDEPMKGSNRFEFMVDICLERDNPDDPLGFGDPSSMEQDTYVMIEATDGYFEAYRHILNVIKNTHEDELPFKSYLVDADKDLRVPYYAAKKRYYDLDTTKKNNRRTPNRKPVDIMGTWPPYDIGMDKTQLDALQTILSNDMAIIQGPPGTGKTHVGAFGMRVLLHNLENHIGPIICICQTNHALDQFLEHIFNFEDRIVRIGGRSKSEILKDNLIYELRKTTEIRGGPSGVGRLYRKRDDISKRIDMALKEMYEDPCVTMEFLTKHKLLRPRQLDCLKRLGEREDKRRKEANGLDGLDSVDDGWVFSSVPTEAPLASKPKDNKKGGKNNQMNKHNDIGGASAEWTKGNPNLVGETAEKPLNAVEVWLQDAIEFIGRQDAVSMYAEEMKDLLLDQQKGLVFDDGIDEEDLIDEEEAQELKQNYLDGQDLRGNKSRFINIGNAYKVTSNNKRGFLGVPDPYLMTSTYMMNGNDANERKVINYKKSSPIKVNKAAAGGWDFFADQKETFASTGQQDYEEQHEVLERWMKDDDVTLWPLTVRLKAHKKWADLRNRHLQQHVSALVEQYNTISVEIRSINAKSDAKICRANRVIGMTSTAAAKYHELLEEIQPSVMVVEEAAEMLESHIVTALTSSLQHLVLIGDHQQLRPSTAVHTLSEQHHMNVSLFERLIVNTFPYTRLSHQRRMRPEIRALINPIYNDPPLQDHVNVTKYPPVNGMERNVYFLSHEEPEDNLADTASKCNLHEAELTARLSSYLLLQGYSPKDITIITMYAGQRAMIKRQLRNVMMADRRTDCDPMAIHVSSVDGYQGEENKIIILSLVRSNMNGQIGFLKVANRVCVALSRAKHGMYIIGNARLLCDKSDLWNEIVLNMEEGKEESIGTTLGLKCASHGVVTRVQWPVDFTEVQEGGCNRSCGTVLDCGHQCPLKCHSYDHEDVRCLEPCRKMFTECGHRCTRRCSSDCGSCITQIRLQLPCGHAVQGDCGKLRRELKAQGGKCRACCS